MGPQNVKCTAIMLSPEDKRLTGGIGTSTTKEDQKEPKERNIM